MNIYQALTNRGLKQADIASKTGLSTSTVSRAIDGKIQPLTASFRAILDRYGLTFTYSSSRVTIIDPWEGVSKEVANLIIDCTRECADYEKNDYESEIEVSRDSGFAVVSYKIAYSVHTYPDGDGEQNWEVSEIDSLELSELSIIAEDGDRNLIDIGADCKKITEIVNNWKP